MSRYGFLQKLSTETVEAHDLIGIENLTLSDLLKDLTDLVLGAWDCLKCSTCHDRDFNANINIRAEEQRPFVLKPGISGVSLTNIRSVGWSS